MLQIGGSGVGCKGKGAREGEIELKEVERKRGSQ